jgi:outer membrane protein assembly factor BamA
MTPTLALQAGGKRVFTKEGRIPFFEAAYLGSSNTLRGFQPHRFAGDASVYGTAELRLHLTNLFLFVPGKQGVFGFTDWGRVYLQDEVVPTGARAWHRTYGGGIWLSFLGRGGTVTAAIGNSDEGNRFGTRHTALDARRSALGGAETEHRGDARRGRRDGTYLSQPVESAG